MPANANKPQLWKSDTLASIDFYNDWFLRFAPVTFRGQREIKTREVADAFKITANLRNITPELLKFNPGILPMLRMTSAPPLARDRLVGLAYTTKNLVSNLEGTDFKPPRVPPRMPEHELTLHLERIIEVLRELADRDLFPWLDDASIEPAEEELLRSASVVADRLCGAAADPIIRNAQEKRQLMTLGSFLQSYGYSEINPSDFDDLLMMPTGTYAFRCNISAGPEERPVNIPVDCIISKQTRRPDELPLLIEAKSAGDATNTNKRRKEEAQKFTQFKQKFGEGVPFILFLCGYFEPGYLGYEAAEGIDWVWEHRINDFSYYLGQPDSSDSGDLIGEDPASYPSGSFSLEAKRLHRQKMVDASKSSLERNRLGQFSTPFPLANRISEYTLLFKKERMALRMLEPAAGSGVFVSSLILQRKYNFSFTCVEIDSAYAGICEDLFAEHGCEVRYEDYFSFLLHKDIGTKYDLLITNPPYVRHHHIDAELKKKYHARIYLTLGIRVSGLAGLYIYYILLSDQVLSAGAIASWLIPGEFLYTNYGCALREYLVKKVSLLRVHRFEAADVQFDDALVSSCVITYRKEEPNPNAVFKVTKGAYDAPSIITELSQGSIRSADKWNFFEETVPDCHVGIPLGELFHVTRGVATGSNSFFILDKKETLINEIPQDFLIPILPSPRDVKTSIIEAEASGVPVVEKQRFLLSVTQSPEDVEQKFPATHRYLEEGKRQGVHKGYICRTRKVWYFQEKRKSPLFLATYMGRNKTGKKCPIRFLLNRSQAIAANVFICLYPKPGLQDLLKQAKEREVELLDALNSIPRNSIENAGRSYGGGLQKVEPRELCSVRLQKIPEWLTLQRIEQTEIFDVQQNTGMTA